MKQVLQKLCGNAKRCGKVLLVGALLLCTSQEILADASSPGYTVEKTQITPDDPWVSFYFRFYDDEDGKKSYFKSTDIFNLTVDGEEVCIFNSTDINKGACLYTSDAANSASWPGDFNAMVSEGQFYKVFTTKSGKRYLLRYVETWHSNYCSRVRVQMLILDCEIGHQYKFRLNGTWHVEPGVNHANQACEWTVTASANMADGEIYRSDSRQCTYSESFMKNYSGWSNVYDLYMKEGNNFQKIASKEYKAENPPSGRVYATLDLKDNYASQYVYVEHSVGKEFTYNFNSGNAAVQRAAGYYTNKGTYTCRFYKKVAETELSGYVKAASLNVNKIDMWNKSVKLTWSESIYSSSSSKDGKWGVFRDGKLVDFVAYGTSQYTDKSEDLYYDRDYKYEVSFVPEGWYIDPESNDATIPDLTSPARTVEIAREFMINCQVESFSNEIVINWTNDAFVGSGHSFSIYKDNGDGKGFGKTPITTINVTNNSQKSYTWTDGQTLSGCSSVRYYIETSPLFVDADGGVAYRSNEAVGMLTSQSHVVSVDASKGLYPTSIKLKWESVQSGSVNTDYELYRRELGTDNSWAMVYSTTGTDESYFYEDNTVYPGTYYQYKIASSFNCPDGDTVKRTSPIEVTTEGFCRSTGIISGRVKYGTGTAVPGVKVTLTKNSEDASLSSFRSVRVNEGSYVQLDKIGSDILKNAWTIQMYIQPDDEGNNYRATVMSSDSNFVMLLNSARDGYDFNCRFPDYFLPGGNSHTFNTVNIKPNEFSNISLSYDGNGVFYLRKVNNDQTISTGTFDYYGSYGSFPTFKPEKPLQFGGTNDYVKPSINPFYGYLDEIRVYNRFLTDEELLSSYDHTLSGSEKGLKMYWTMDEGIENQTVFYDYSKTTGVGNNNHGKLVSCKSSTIVPTEDQLSLYGVTDETGNYIINGIPFSGEGTNYLVTPTMGIHQFSPMYSTSYISTNSLIHSGVDFEDISAFTVSGNVYYENTDYPVEGAEFYIDGVVCTKDGELCTTDANGHYEISVPIGKHHIAVKKSNHTFVNNGRYPSMEGEEHVFDQNISNLVFWDNTMVTVAGRVCGGEAEKEKPLGLAQSVNNIGQAEIRLKVNNYRLNTYVDKNGVIQTNTETRALDNATDSVACSAYIGEGDFSSYVTILTDAKTGEWAVKMPPIAYTVDRVTVMNNEEATDQINQQSFANINATSASELFRDSVEVDEGKYESFKYCTSQIISYNSTPSFTVTDKSNGFGAFGEATVEYDDPLEGSVDVPVYIYNEDYNTLYYKFDYPIFNQYGTYTFMIKAFEEYKNYDDPENIVTTIVPLEGAKVTVANELSSEQSVYAEDGEVDGIRVSQGDFASITENSFELNDKGEAIYQWVAGFPNISGDFTRNINITYTYANRSYQWSENGNFKGIIFGGAPSGANFVTSGPDKLMFVLRDPPGSGSSASWTKGTSIEVSEVVTMAYENESGVETKVSCGNRQQIIAGTPGAGTITDIGVKADAVNSINIEDAASSGKVNAYTIETTKTISTSGENDYVGADADVFVGAATNIIIGNSRNVMLAKGYDSYDIIVADKVTASQKFGTTFSYSQHYIIETLIPNFYKTRNSLLLTVSQEDFDRLIEEGNKTSEPLYITTLSSDDPRFGSSNQDVTIWGSEAQPNVNKFTGPSYTMLVPNTSSPKDVFQDEILWYNQQVELWKTQLANNEKAKLDAINDREKYLSKQNANISFDAGALVSSSYSKCKASGETYETDFKIAWVAGVETGFDINEMGTEVNVTTSNGFHYNSAKDSTVTECTEVAFDLVESGNDALTIDVFDAPDEFGPIFVTRGGQTSCPYEGEAVTRFYQPGKSISAATMRIEVPKISVENNFATDVPAGGQAIFNLLLMNESETGENVWFYLDQVEGSNANGAILSVDGTPLTSQGRQISVPAGEVVKKTLTLAQSNPDVLDYENLGIILHSMCDQKVADTVFLSAQFVPACTPVTLQINDPVLNTFQGNVLTATIKDYDPSFGSFKKMQVLYKMEGDAKWILADEYVLKESDLTNLNKLLPDGGRIPYNFDMSNATLYPDGIYQFKVQTGCQFGTDEVYAESDVVNVVKDMARPQVLGNPQPSDGILNAGDEISVTFNEDIRNGSLTLTNNFIVQGVLNDAEVAHDVALKLDNNACAASTEASIILANQDFSMDMWINVASAGTIVEHGIAPNNFKVEVTADKKLQITIGDKTIKSAKTIPFDSWSFLTINYTASTGAVSALVANDSSSDMLFVAEEIGKYNGNGNLYIGKGISGAISELTLWNTNRSCATAQGSMYNQKAASTQNLIGYWKFDEGHGSLATDKARSRNMKLDADSWYINNINYAASFDGESYANLNVTKCVPLTTDDYLIEFWFRGDKQNDAALFSIGNSLGIKANDKGNLTLTTKGEDIELSQTNYFDNAWHHFALNVLRNGMTSVYVDGKVVKQIASNNVATPSADVVTLAAQRQAGTIDWEYNNNFTGDIDEFRFWIANINATAIEQNRYNRLNGDEKGLVAYYPFEVSALDEYMQPVVLFSAKDYSTTDAGTATIDGVEKASSSPALKVKPEMSNIPFSFVASERTINVTLNEVASRLEGSTITFTIQNVKDQNENPSLPVTWTAYVNQNRLLWSDDKIAFEQKNLETKSATVRITNQSGTSESWTITNVPSWLSVNKESGSLSALASEDITFTTSEAAPAGKYETLVYVSGNDNINVPILVSLIVKAEKPDWTVNPADFETSMNILGQLKFEDEYATSEEDMVAAFVDGKCVGVANPKYFARYDAYFVIMDIYGDSDASGKDVDFKAWNSNGGIIYPIVSVSEEVQFQPVDVIGSMREPFIWNATNAKEQNIALKAGWNWVSLNIKPNDGSLKSVMNRLDNVVVTVKDKSSFAQPISGEWLGSLDNMSVGKMYRIKTSEAATMNIVGNPTTNEDEVTINPKWNWIGYNSLYSSYIDEAFADANPKDGDIVKGQTGFAIYQDYEWVGSLTTLVPGQGYMYYSTVTDARSFSYPATSSFTPGYGLKAGEMDPTYEAVDNSIYSGNMTMVAVVKKDKLAVAGAEVGIFAGTECRASAFTNDLGLAFITIPGDAQVTLSVKVKIDGTEYTDFATINYADDQMLGTISSPYALAIGDNGGEGGGVDPLDEEKRKYDEAYAAGYAAGQAKGKTEGYENGSKAGYEMGYNTGKSEGYEAGYEAGETEGYQSGYDKGNKEGQETGYAAGQTEGYQSGYDKGTAEGHEAGYTEGQEAGYQSGYEKGNKEGYDAGCIAGNEDAYNAGVEAGKTAGYQEGFEAGKIDGYDEGYEAGDTAGFKAGYRDGYHDGFVDGNQTAINEVLNQGQISIYPNPAISVINIVADAEIDNVRIFNVAGQLVATAETKQIDVTALMQGFYIVEVEFTDGSLWKGNFLKK